MARHDVEARTALDSGLARSSASCVAALAHRRRGAPDLRTSVMTHIAWVPEEWVEAAEDVLAGLAERHPSRTIVLLPAARRGRTGSTPTVESECFPVGEGRDDLHGDDPNPAARGRALSARRASSSRC